MKFLKNRVLPVFFAFSLLISLCVVPAYASFPDGYRDYDSVSDWEARINNPGDAFLELAGTAFQINTPDTSSVFWALVDTVVTRDVGETDSVRLEQICSSFEAAFDRPWGDSFFSQLIQGSKEIFSNSVAYMFLGTMDLNFVIEEHPVSGLMRIKETTTGLWVVNSAGAYPYCESGSNFATSGGNQWISKTSAESKISGGEVLTGSQMKQTVTSLQLAGEQAYVANFGSKYKAIYRDGREVYANANGYPFVSAADDAEWAVNQVRPDTGAKDENGEDVEGLPEDNVTNIDLSGMTVTLPDGSINIIDQIIYDESTKSYHIDSHDTYNYTINNYYTWNYYINYTSITYIGQTEEYNKYYEVYYELPDGRDSADLTKEEVEQLNLSIDVIPYGRSADDTSLRSLYHFDGDTRDSSYWNYCTDFTWNTGASLTYMDAGVFDGALYLDETEHDFTLTLPSNIGTNDFTLQFRYYQSVTPAPVIDSYIQIGNSTVLQFNGTSFVAPNGSEITSVPIGTWNEVAFIRSGSRVYWYLNGVCIHYGSALASVYYNNLINFHFGSSQQTFKYFDELRVLNYALVEGGNNYEPTSVPHDTNLTLVLPDSAVPVADEYWEITSSGMNLLTSDFMSGSMPSNVQEYTFTYNTCFNHATTPIDVFYYDTNFTDVSIGKDSLIVSSHGSRWDFWDNPQQEWARGLLLNFGTSQSYALNNAKYTFSVVLSDGSVSSVSFWSHSGSSVKGTFDWGEMGLYVGDYQNDDVDYLTVYIDPYSGGQAIEILYAELVKATSTDLTATKIESVTAMDKEDLNTPTLAVRTDLDITSYQIGGVRPSIPTKGQVWALVENERITSIQIYNGQAWEACDGRIWTGSRWIPASSYNIVTLQDMYDIVDATQDYEYIYSESGFWSWWQKSWNAFTEKLFGVLGSGGSGAAGGCQHAYAITAEIEATCADPGERTYTCALCENQYVEPIPALGHDWIQKEKTPTTYALPEGTACPDCAGLDYAAELNEDSATYSCTCNSCETVWTVQAEVTEGETLYTCSRCGETTTETDKENEGFFDALGNFLADGVEWVTDKLKQLVDSLDGLNQIFSDYVKTIREKAGEYPAFLSAAIAFLPEDLMAVFWFSVVAFVLLAVWKKWLR